MDHNKHSTAAEQKSDASEYPSAKFGWYVVFVLYLSYTFSFVDRAIIVYLAGPIRADLQIDEGGK